ncbi:MAG: beta-galactosidase, partial [Bacteroidales bacterium]|nr:beta-galactosidase [Bacteroidales bacterium]
MKKTAFSLVLFLLAGLCSASAQSWQPAGDHIRTPWAEQVSPESPLPEYPRPLLQRSRWMNLNGLWDYAVRKTGEAFGKAD